MKDFEIRTATVDDVPVILELIRALAEYERATAAEVPATEELLRETLFGPQPQSEVLLVCDNTQPQGFAVFFHNYSTWRAKRGLYLEDLFVRPAARGRGMGKALLVALAKIAVARDCALMQWAVLDWNQPSIDFYKSLGALPLDEWTIFRLEPPAMHKLASA